MAILTVKTLLNHGACTAQVLRFQRLFGTSVEVTEDLCAAHAMDFSWDWAANHLLSDEGRTAYVRAREQADEAFDVREARAWDVFNKIKGQVEDTDPAAAEVLAFAYDTYCKLMKPTRALYTKAQARAFGRFYGQ